jgi:hypothetical protein
MTALEFEARFECWTEQNARDATVAWWARNPDNGAAIQRVEGPELVAGVVGVDRREPPALRQLVLVLAEYLPELDRDDVAEDPFTGRQVVALVTYSTAFVPALRDGWVAMGLGSIHDIEVDWADLVPLLHEAGCRHDAVVL